MFFFIFRCQFPVVYQISDHEMACMPGWLRTSPICQIHKPCLIFISFEVIQGHSSSLQRYFIYKKIFSVHWQNSHLLGVLLSVNICLTIMLWHQCAYSDMPGYFLRFLKHFPKYKILGIHFYWSMIGAACNSLLSHDEKPFQFSCQTPIFISFFFKCMQFFFFFCHRYCFLRVF